MHVLSDIDANTWFLTALVFGVFAISLGLTWRSFRNEWKIQSSWLGLGAILAVCPLFLVYDAYCPDADQPHIQVAGQAVPLRSYFYSEGKHTVEGTVIRVEARDIRSPQLELDRHASSILTGSHSPSRFRFIYLQRTEEANLRNGLALIAHPVVEVSDAETGERLFYVDTSRHWPRVILLVCDACFGCLSWFVILRMARLRPDPEEGVGNFQSDNVHPMPNDLTGLSLNADDTSSSS
jgi:hypothetical protein